MMTGYASITRREREAERVAAAIAIRRRLDEIAARKRLEAVPQPKRVVAEPRVIYDAPIGPVDYPSALGPAGQITVRYIVAMVASRCCVVPEAFMGRKRYLALFYARQEIIWLTFVLSGLTAERIAAELRRSRQAMHYARHAFVKRHGLPADHQSLEARRIACQVLLHGIDRASEMWRARGDA